MTTERYPTFAMYDGASVSHRKGVAYWYGPAPGGSWVRMWRPVDPWVRVVAERSRDMIRRWAMAMARNESLEP